MNITSSDILTLKECKDMVHHFGCLAAQSYEWQLQRDYGKLRSEWRMKYLLKCAEIVGRSVDLDN